MELSEFIVKAKVNTYANSGAEGELLGNDGSKELIFREEPWLYRDRYFGTHTFVGEEVISKDGKAAWVMNYYGQTLSDTIDPRKLYDFLQVALRQVTSDRPYRGPEEFTQNDLRYQNQSRGSVESFSGTETIQYQNTKVYELSYHGGLVR